MKFTPICSVTGKRLKLDVEECEIPRGRVEMFKVREISTGRIYDCTTKPCGLANRCICDAMIFDYKGEVSG